MKRYSGIAFGAKELDESDRQNVEAALSAIELVTNEHLDSATYLEYEAIARTLVKIRDARWITAGSKSERL